MNADDNTERKMDGGYTRLFRRLWSNPVFRTKQEAAVFAYMSNVAQWREAVTIASKFGPLELAQGEIIIAERELSADFGLYRKALRSLLQRMEAAQMIVLIRDRIPARAGTVVRIVKYAVYQPVTAQQAAGDDRKTDALGTANGAAKEPQRDRKGTASDTKNKEPNNSNLSLVPSAPDAATASQASDAIAKPRGKRGPYAEHPKFDEVWRALPSRGECANPRKDACIKFSRVVAEGADPDLILQGARGYAAAMKKGSKERTEFVQQGVTFLSKETWRQYLGPVEVGPQRYSPAYYDAFATWKAAGQVGPQPRPEDFKQSGLTAA